VTMSAAEETKAGAIDSKEDTTSQGTGREGGAGTGVGTGIGNGQGSGLGEGSGGGTGGGVYRPGNGVESPRLLRSVRPNYTAEAMRAKMQGVVRLEGVVLPDGTVGDLKVTRSLDPVFGLDQEAIKAAKQFRFVPGTRFGEPVAVLVSFEIEFTLR
jgi:periplasmic protein TonB